MEQLIEPKFEVERYRFLKTKLLLDLTEIDNEIVQMSVILQDCGERVAVAVAIRDGEKDQLGRTEAEVGDRLRKDFAEGTKPRSEAQIAKETPLDPAYVKQQTAYSDACLDAALWQKLFDALQSKNFNIKTAGDLIISGYLTRDSIINRRRQEISASKERIPVRG